MSKKETQTEKVMKDARESDERIAEIVQKEEEALLQEQIEELTDTLKRLQAEFENYKKRAEKENAHMIKNANAGLIKNILSVLDSFELAIKNSNGSPEIEKFKKGVEMIYAQLFDILEDQGLRIIETKDRMFDPYKHEVLMTSDTEGEEDMILQEFQKGYMLNDTVLRHAKVMVIKHRPKEERGDENG